MIYIAADRHGYKAIKFAVEFLKKNKIEYENLGVTNAAQDLKLEHMIPEVVKKVKNSNTNKAILSCGTGVGVEVGTNKFSGIRACLAANAQIAKWSRIYDDCNVLCLAGWKCTKKQIHSILKAWFSSSYDGDQARLQMFKEFNKWH